MSSFAVPAFLGTQVRFQVLTTQLYRTLNGLNPGYGYIMAFVMILFGTSILAVNQWFVGKRKSFTTVTGKSSNIALARLRGFRTPISILLVAFVGAIAILPLVTFAVESFIMAPGDYSLGNLTTQFWVGAGSEDVGGGEPGILLNKYIYLGLWNSVKLSVVVAFIAGTVGSLAGYAIVKARGTKLSGFVNNLAFFPYLMPSMAFGAIYLSMFAKPTLFLPSLYGTFALLVIVGSVKYLPFASRAGVNAMLQLSNEIEEAGIILGIPWRKRMTRIIFPIQKASFLSGYLLPFISCMRELALFVILIVPPTGSSRPCCSSTTRRAGTSTRTPLTSSSCSSCSSSIRSSTSSPEPRSTRESEDRMPEILLKSVTKKFGKFVAVDSLDLAIADGDFVTLLGPSGCGKTTTLRMIAGLESPTEGEIRIGGKIVFSSESGVDVPPDKRDVGFLFQNYALWPHMTVEQNISFGLENLKWEKNRIRARVAELLATLKIAEFGKRYPSELSGGQQQRVAIARTSRRDRKCCSWTNRSPISTRSSAPRCARNSSASTWRRTPHSSTSPTISSRR